MAPVLHLVRHAQGYHNLGAEFHSLTDPKLTPLGEEQCALLKTKFFPDQSKISLITASPLTRTIHTAYATFSPALTNGQCRAQIVALPDAQETSDFPCDTGSDIPVLTKKCADEGWPVDLARLNDAWNIKTSDSRYSPSGTAIRERARATRQQIRELAKELVAAGNPDPEIVLVTHGAFLHYFTEDWEDSDKYLGTGWLNTETRAYNFEAGIDSADHDAHIIETNASRARRGKASPAFPRAEQEKMYHTSMQGWENQGLQNPTKLDPAHAVAAGVQADEIKVAA